MIYADFNATTPMGIAARREVERAMEVWGNPSSTHDVGRKANEMLETYHIQIARTVGVEPTEVVFTSGGSEANTTALLGSFFLRKQDFRLLTSKVEHSSIKDTVDLIFKQGAMVEYAKQRSSGALDLESFEKALIEFKPHLVSLMTANNETGIIFPVPEIANLCKNNGVPFHTDAVQALGKVPSSVFLDADLISVSAHKIYGPKGAGALVVKRGVQLVPTHYGGGQEIRRRGGTQNMIGIAGFAGACSELLEFSGGIAVLETLRNRFEENLTNNLEGIFIQGREAPRIPNTTNVRFAQISAEVLLSVLDIEGVCVSAGSACFSGAVNPSHVLIAIGLTPQEAKETLRFSWGRTTTPEEIDLVADLVIKHVHRIRTRKIKEI